MGDIRLFMERNASSYSTVGPMNRTLLSTGVGRQGNRNFTGDEALSRRLGFGKLSIGARAMQGARFTAVQDIERGSVTANLTHAAAGVLSITVVLDPAQNWAMTSVAVSTAMEVTLKTEVLPLKDLCRSHDPSSCIQMDGSTSAGASAGHGGLLWAHRMPFGISSPRPISAAVATSLVSGELLACINYSSSSAGCTAEISPAQPGKLGTAVVTNLDLCDTSAGCGDPLPAATDAAAALVSGGGSALDELQVASAAFWRGVWMNASIAMPGDRAVEQFYYAQTYMIMSASRKGRVAAGLWGPWVHTDNPEWAGDFTLDYNHEANHWGLYSNNRFDAVWPQYQPLIDYIPTAMADAAMYNCSGLHFPGHIAPFGEQATLTGEPWASMSIHSNGVLAALNMIQHWEYSQDRSFLREVALPFASGVLDFYKCWMNRTEDGVWTNAYDQSHECNPAGPACVRLSAYALPRCTFMRRSLCAIMRELLVSGSC